MKRKYETQNRVGSALILTVVLTSLLAIVGVMFVLVSRLDKMATSGLSENKELNSAAETVVAKISQELALDVPHTDANGIVLSEYYDYPGLADIWLACLEPYWFDTGDYRWRQTSDVYGVLGTNALDLQAEIVDDYQPTIAEDDKADADGDGVADSVWVAIPDMTSGKGKTIYAAVRIIDNGGMLNVNTAYKFDPNDTEPNIDGSSQMQINLMALAWRPPALPTEAEAIDLREARAGSEDPNDLDAYEQNVVWCYGQSNGSYTPFDISDELELRYRFLLNHTDIDTRLEDWGGEFRNKWTSSTPFKNKGDWFISAYDNGSLDPNYAYRHIATIYNMDRIINPLGLWFNNGKMVNVNTDNESLLYDAIREGLIRGGVIDPNSLVAQLAVNIKDYVDTDEPNVTVFNGYYGFERPCVYISELAHRFVEDTDDPSIIYESYAVELYMPYAEDNHPVGWQLVVDGNDYPLDSWVAGQYYVLLNENTMAPLGAVGAVQMASIEFKGGTSIELQRPIPGGGYITVDSFPVPRGQLGWLLVDDNAHSIQRDINRHKCIRRLCSGPLGGATLGSTNSYTDPSTELIQAHPYLDPNVYEGKGFKNIGETGMVFVKSAYSEGPNSIGPNDVEDTARLDLSKSIYQQIFNYLTVFPPVEYVPDPDETRIKGRLNINTAPWFVLAQLPWVSAHTPNYELAKAIIAYRDKLDLSPSGPDYSGRWGEQGFRSTGELNNVVFGGNPDYRIDYYALDPCDLDTFPDLTPSDGVNDFEERDLIFARISNLVTVRSDVFTAYILVRIGRDGPQKRVMAILDRSNVYSPGDKVRIVALHPVPDPR